MVSKIAVMALVGILAVPILIGYAFNLSEVSVTEYKPEGEPMNVTPLLQNGTSYNYVSADMYRLNSQFATAADTPSMYPYFDKITDSYTSLPMYRYHYDGVEIASTVYPTAQQHFTEYNHWYFQIERTISTGYLNVRIVDYDDENNVLEIPRIRSIFWDYDQLRVYGTFFISDSLDQYSSFMNIMPDNYYYLQFYSVGDYNSISYMERSRFSDNISYVDISGGYHFAFYGEGDRSRILLPTDTKSVTMTINLDSITDSNYQLNILAAGASITLDKTTNGSEVNWTVLSSWMGYDDIPLYYDPNRSDNTYQITITNNFSHQYESGGSTRYVYNINVDYNYVGGWPGSFGIANYYKTYNEVQEFDTSVINVLDMIVFFPDNTPSRSPTMRLDNALYRGFEYYIIDSKTYDPTAIMSNPATTIKDIRLYGSSLTFGGNTYNVDKSGNITMGTHKVPVNNLVLDSVPVAVGYENRINGTVVSVSSVPSTITFNGQWSASISTVGQSATTYNKTEWTAGSFGWDGIDDNFLIVGLVSCLGVFIGLGIYARRTGKGIMPLLIVCGCAVGLFICML